MWQPIETAPKDQTFLAVLNCAGQQTICTMRWAVAEEKNSRPDHYVFHVERVTHWMPLPDLPGAQPAPSLASNDVSLISEGKTQPAQSVKDVIIDDLQSQFDTEGITEHDSGDALIRLSDAIAAVEDNFAPPAPSIPDGWLRAIDEALVVAHIGVANESDTYEQAKAKLDTLIRLHADIATDPAVNGGWKLVPIEPTQEMSEAGVYAGSIYYDVAEATYEAMLAAAPEAKL